MYNLDSEDLWAGESTEWEEIDVISSMGQFTSPEHFVNTGFIHAVSYKHEDEMSTFI